jgi:uncharacterized protein YneF (UPF0154 family)
MDAGASLTWAVLVIPMAVLGLASLGFWIWMLVDCLSNEPSGGNDKLIWALVIVFTGWIGAAIYFFVRRPQRKTQFGV